MKFNLAEKQQQKKAEDPNAIPTQCCVICQKVIPAAYGRFMVNDREVWTCSKRHNAEYQEKRDDDSKCA